MKYRPKFVIGDIHGIPDEMEELIQWAVDNGISYKDIWLLGDIFHRGPDDSKCVRMARRMGINSILGNHDNSVVNQWAARCKGRQAHPNPDKELTLSRLTQEDVDWVAKLPPLHVFDESKLILVHGGVWPHIPLFKQPKNIIRCQMIKPYDPGQSRWWGPKAKEGCKHSEEESYAQGWRRWYEVYDFKHDIAFGHSVFQAPLIYKNPDSGTVFGLDTGGVFGGWLTGMIHDGPGNFHVKQIRAKKTYCVDMMKQFGEINE